MKNKSLCIAMILGVSTTFAQDLTSKKGEKYLPEAKDWAIGFNAEPVLNSIGRVMGGNSYTNLSNPMGANNYIVGKMFKDEKTAYRAALGINFGSTNQKTFVMDVTSTAVPPAMVEDVKKTSSNSITLGGGIEKRRGMTRLQGYYGGMLMVSLGGGKSTYEYGNALSATNTFHTNTYNQGAGVTESKNGSTFGVGVNGFVGAEYFIAPKLSIGAEYWWGVNLSSTGKGSSTSEAWVNNAATSTTVETAGSSSFNIGNSVGLIMVNFHF